MNSQTPITEQQARTIPEIARLFNQPEHRIRYVVTTRRIDYFRRIGRTMLYRPDQVEQIVRYARELEQQQNGGPL